MVRKIVTVKNQSLRQKSKAVTKFDKKISSLIEDMEATLKAQADPEGVGLAAPQVGVPLRIFVVNYRKNKLIAINPQVISQQGKLKPKTKGGKQILEGCLSLPHYYGPIARAEQIKVKYQTPKMVAGKWQLVKKLETFTGFIAHIIQHEIDHLEGILFIDRLLEQKSQLYSFTSGNFEEVDLR